MENESDAPTGGSVFDTVTEVLEALRSFLTSIGLELSLLAVQLFALAIIAVLLALAVWRIVAKAERRTAKILSAVLLFLAAVGTKCRRTMRRVIARETGLSDHLAGE